MNSQLNIKLLFCFLFFGNFTFAQSSQILYAHRYINQAEKYNAYLNYGEAIRYYEAGINIFIETFDKNHPLVNINYVAIGKNYLATYDFKKAKLYCNNAYQNIEKNFPNSAIAAQCLECLGEIAQAEKEYELALDYYQKAAKVHTQLWGKNHYASSELYLLFGYFYLENNQFPKAFDYFEQVKNLNQKNEDIQQQFYTAQALEAIGDWYFQQNNFEKAILNFNQSIDFYQRVNSDKHPTIAKVNLKLGNVFYQQSKLEKALKAYDLSYASFQDYSLKLLEIEGYDTCRCNQILIAGIIGKAQIYQEQYKKDKEQNNLQTALKYYQQATKKVNLSVQFFAKDAIHRQQILHQNKNIFVDAIVVSYQLYQLTQKEEFTKTAFNLMNNYKALTLKIQQKENQIMNADIPAATSKKAESWKTKIAALRFEVYEAEAENLSTLKAKKQALLNAMTNQATFLRAFEHDYWYIKDSVFQESQINLQTISTTLNSETVLLNYVLDKKNNQLFFIIINNKKIAFRTIPIPNDFINKIEKLYRLLQSSLLNRTDKKQQFVQNGNELYQYLIEPIQDLLIHKKRLVIIRDDALHLLPFEVLLKNNTNTDFKKLDYLINDFEISYHYSVQLWERSSQQKWQGKTNSLLAFAPVFDKSENIDLAETDAAFRCFVQNEVQIPLPHSENEVRTIQEVLKTTESSVLLRSKASKSQLLKSLKESYRFVHIASHSFANYDNAQFSGIACFMNEAIQKRDCMLYINEIENLKINSDLVVLSSCESGAGQLLQGEGLLGINRSFLYAGVPNTLFSLWKVQDEATAILMIEFYKNVQKNMDYVQALRQAKLTLLQNPKTAIPIFWASFILMGR